MDYFIAFFIAFILNFVGMIPPGIITLKLVNIRVKKSYKTAILFSYGVIFVEFFQTFATLHFSKLFYKYFFKNDFFQWISIIVLIVVALSILLTKSKRKEFNKEELHVFTKSSSFVKGALFSLLNFLKYPFWIAQGIFLMKKGILVDEKILLIVFSFGAMLGSFSMYYVYIKVGNVLINKFNVLSKNLNKIIAFFLLFLALLQLGTLIF